MGRVGSFGGWTECGYDEAQTMPRYKMKKITSGEMPKKIEGGVVLKAYTTKAVANWLDLSERRVRQLRDEKVITEIRPGLYDLKTVNKQYINYLRKNNPESESAIDYNAERAKLVRAKRESQELELQMRRNEVHTTEDVEQVMTDTLVRFKTRLMAVPAKLSPILSKKKDQTEIFKLLKNAIDEALEELSDFQTVFGYGIDDEKENG
jgi:phage terminase Nu1 subunit (DNA packaging protein)